MGGSRFCGLGSDLKRLDARQMIDGVLKRPKNFWIAIVVIQVNQNVSNARNEFTQNFTLHGGEVEEAIQYEQFNLGQPWNVDVMPVKFTFECCQRAHLISIGFRELVTLQQVGISRVDQSDFLVEIDLPAKSASNDLCGRTNPPTPEGTAGSTMMNA